MTAISRSKIFSGMQKQSRTAFDILPVLKRKSLRAVLAFRIVENCDLLRVKTFSSMEEGIHAVHSLGKPAHSANSAVFN
jgi:hypothetical protein